MQLMRDIVAEGPEAERVVMTMSYTYKAAGQPEGITQVGLCRADAACHWRLSLLRQAADRWQLAGRPATGGQACLLMPRTRCRLLLLKPLPWPNCLPSVVAARRMPRLRRSCHAIPRC